MELDRRQLLKTVGLVAGLGLIDGALANSPAPTPKALQRGRRAAVEPLARVDHSMCLLPGNLVLVIGGQGIGGNLVSCQIYDPDTDLWFDAAPLSLPRALHSSTLLNGSEVLVLGGYNGAALELASTYNPVRDTWAPSHPLRIPRYRHGAQALPDGRVVLTGGFFMGPLTEAEVYEL